MGNTSATPRAADVSTKQQRIAQLARQMSGKALTSLSRKRHRQRLSLPLDFFRRRVGSGLGAGVSGGLGAGLWPSLRG